MGQPGTRVPRLGDTVAPEKLRASGFAAQLFKDQALTVSISILASLAVALTLIPMVAARGKRIDAQRAESGDDGTDSFAQRAEAATGNQPAGTRWKRFGRGMAATPRQAVRGIRTGWGWLGRGLSVSAGGDRLLRTAARAPFGDRDE